MKQTAVEFAVGKLEQFIPKGNQIVIKAILEHSKEMERQQERMYSEEDMMDYSNYRLLIKKALSPKEWFEKFKNK
jgi:ribosomal protein L24